MIKLNDRLQKIADNIESMETMADIGTDHGFLPIFLRQSGKCPRVILTDVSKASLDKGMENCLRLADIQNGLPEDSVSTRQDEQPGESEAFGDSGLPEGVQFRVGDGLTVLSPGEVDTVVIAGMGGKLIKSILSADMELTCSFKKFIMQPRVGQGELRKWLCDHEFAIVSEDLAVEGDYIPEIITVLSPDFRRCGHTGGSDNTNRMDGDLGNSCHQDRSGDLERLYRPNSSDGNNKNLAADFKQMLAGLEGDDMQYRIPPWILQATGPVDEFLQRNIDKEKEILKNVMLSKTREINQEAQICDRIYYLKGLLKKYRKEVPWIQR